MQTIKLDNWHLRDKKDESTGDGGPRLTSGSRDERIMSEVEKPQFTVIKTIHAH